MKLKKGDKVKVLIGKDKSRESTIIKVYPELGKVLVEGVNQYKKHVKGQAQGGQPSEIVTLTKPLPASNVAFICPNCKKTARVGYEMKADKKVRVCRKCGSEI